MEFVTLEENVVSWAEARKIIPNAKPEVQLLKTVEEYGEVAAALARNNVADLKDGIGDVLVTVIIANQLAEEPVSLSEIKDSINYLTFNENSNFSEIVVLGASSISGILNPVLFDAANTKTSLATLFLVLHLLAESVDSSLEECLELAYNVIKDRKGTLTAEGVFIKEEDIK